MKKRVALIFISIISLFTFIGCGDKVTPTEVAEGYLESIQSGSNNDVQRIIKDKVEKIKKDKNEENKLCNYIINDSNTALSKLEFTIEKETIASDKAEVEVTVKGINFNNIIQNLLNNESAKPLIQEAMTGELTDNTKIEELNKLIINEINNSELEERKETINLSQKDKDWKISLNDNFYKLIFGTSNI